MKLIWWMLAGSLLTALVLSELIVPESGRELWFGMFGPLASAVISWALIHRQYRRHPEKMTALLIKSFAAKMVFFAVYITVLVSFGSVKPIPFAVSFACYFIALHVVEAIGLHRLQSAGRPEPPVELQGQLKDG